MKRSLFLWVPLGAVVLIQLLPIGRNHTNPPVTAPVRWDSPGTEALARRACYDCHSNETRWPWYSNVAPMSWMIQDHVDEGREHLNFSNFDPGSRRMTHAAGEAAEEVTKGEMPLKQYLPLHPEARLSAAETQALAQGLAATFGGPRGGEEAPTGAGGAGEESEEHEHDGD